MIAEIMVSLYWEHFIFYTPAPRRGRGVYCFTSIHLSTGSRNLMGPKTLPTIWGTYMKLVTKYQISAINSYWEKCDEKYLGRTDRWIHIVGSVFGPIRFLLPVCRFCWFLYTFNIHLYMHIFRHIFLCNYWWPPPPSGSGGIKNKMFSV
jgi:hypothetical protein